MVLDVNEHRPIAFSIQARRKNRISHDSPRYGLRRRVRLRRVSSSYIEKGGELESQLTVIGKQNLLIEIEMARSIATITLPINASWGRYTAGKIRLLLSGLCYSLPLPGCPNTKRFSLFF